MEIALGVICLIGLLVAYEALKHSKQQKENEWDNKHRSKKSNKKKQKSFSSAKVSKPKAQNKRKHRRIKESKQTIGE